MREIEIRSSQKIKLGQEDGSVMQHFALDLTLPETDGVFPTLAGDLFVRRIETPPGLELKGDAVGGNTVFVAISHNPKETDSLRKFGGTSPLGDNGAVTVYTREFRDQLGSGALLPGHPKDIYYPQRNTP